MVFRRVIIVICILILCFDVIAVWPESKLYSSDLEKLVKEGSARVVEVNKSFMIDNDVMKIMRLITTHDKTYIRFALVEKEIGWSFPDTSIIIIDDAGKEYQCYGGGSSGKSWGEEGLLQTEAIAEDTKQITIKFKHFDRENQLSIPLLKEGKADES